VRDDTKEVLKKINVIARVSHPKQSHCK